MRGFIGAIYLGNKCKDVLVSSTKTKDVNNSQIETLKKMLRRALVKKLQAVMGVLVFSTKYDL